MDSLVLDIVRRPGREMRSLDIFPAAAVRLDCRQQECILAGLE